MKHLLRLFVLYVALASAVAHADALDDMLQAVKGGYADTVRSLLGKGMDANAVDADGNSLLFLAAREGNADVVSALLAAGANTETRNNFKESPLMIAAFKGRLDIVRLLLDKGASPTGKGWTPLIYAAYGGHADAAALLLDRGAQPDERTDNGTTALMMAAKGGFGDVVDVLLKHHASLGLRNDEGKSAADWARETRNTDVADRIERDASRREQAVVATRAGHDEAVARLLAQGLDPETTDADGHTLLMIAVQEGYPTVVKALLQGGAKANVKDAGGNTPMLVAAYKGREEILRLLLESGVKPEGDNADALIFAAMHCSDGPAKMLVQSGIDLNHKTEDGSTALITAARNDCNAIARLLLERGADDRAANRAGRTALSYAIEEGNDGREQADMLAVPAIRRFVAQWFAWMDQLADEDLFISSLAPKDFQAQLPDVKLRSGADFQKWYRALRDGLASNSHQLSEVAVAPLPAGGYSADFTENWRSAPYGGGEPREEKLLHHWEVLLGQDGQVYLRRMTVARPAPLEPPAADPGAPQEALPPPDDATAGSQSSAAPVMPAE